MIPQPIRLQHSSISMEVEFHSYQIHLYFSSCFLCIVKPVSEIFSSLQQGLEELNDLIHDFSSLVHVSLLNILPKYSNVLLA